MVLGQTMEEGGFIPPTFEIDPVDGAAGVSWEVMTGRVSAGEPTPIITTQQPTPVYYPPTSASQPTGADVPLPLLLGLYALIGAGLFFMVRGIRA